MRVNGWSVKIQLFGKRKTFRLNASDRGRASIEACKIYQAVQQYGWESVGRGGVVSDLRSGLSNGGGVVAEAISDVEYWKRRLIHRRYPEPREDAAREFSVRVEHSAVTRYFPLGTDDEAEAAQRAMRIYQTVTGGGWAIANEKFTRELTIALRWLDDPLAWTYTTIHTWKSGDPMPALTAQVQRPGVRNVAIVEPDTGLRLALVGCVGSQTGFRCCGAYAGVTEAAREVSRQKVDMVLANYTMPEQVEPMNLAELRRMKPNLISLFYSVFEDSDQLFKATPGGAAGYMLKRTPWYRIFDPIAETKEALTQELVARLIREYFQKLVAAMPAGASALDLAKLTPREHEILALLAKGELAKEIADSLGISIWTVHGHVKSIFEKLNVHTRTEAVVKFLQK